MERIKSVEDAKWTELVHMALWSIPRKKRKYHRLLESESLKAGEDDFEWFGNKIFHLRNLQERIGYELGRRTRALLIGDKK